MSDSLLALTALTNPGLAIASQTGQLNTGNRAKDTLNVMSSSVSPTVAALNAKYQDPKNSQGMPLDTFTALTNPGLAYALKTGQLNSDNAFVNAGNVLMSSINPGFAVLNASLAQKGNGQ